MNAALVYAAGYMVRIDDYASSTRITLSHGKIVAGGHGQAPD